MHTYLLYAPEEIFKTQMYPVAFCLSNLPWVAGDGLVEKNFWNPWSDEAQDMILGEIIRAEMEILVSGG